jgi:hypothetical protein
VLNAYLAILKTYFQEFRFSVSVAFILTIVAVTLDLQVSNISDFVHRFTTSDLGLGTFLIESFFFWISQAYLILLMRSKIREIKFMGKELLLIQNIIPASYVLLLVLNLILLIQIFLLHQYFVVYLILIVGVSYGLNVFLMSYLSYVLLFWHQKKGNKILASFGISSTLATISGLLTLIFIGAVLFTKGHFINSGSHVVFPIYSPNSIFGIISYLNTYIFLFSFILMWMGTALLFAQYYRKLGKFKFLLMVASPLIFFVGQFFTVINFFFPFIDSSSLSFVFSYSIVFSFSSIIGSIIFGAGFWLLGRSVSDKEVSSYLNMTGYGLVMFFTAATATVIHTPFPPFGIVAISLVGFSSYFVLYGLYSSSIAISQDVDLRKRIRKSTEAHVRLLDNIGAAQLQDSIETKISEVAHVIEKELKAESGITSSVSEQEIKDYVKSVIREISDKK